MDNGDCGTFTTVCVGYTSTTYSDYTEYDNQENLIMITCFNTPYTDPTGQTSMSAAGEVTDSNNDVSTAGAFCQINLPEITNPYTYNIIIDSISTPVIEVTWADSISCGIGGVKLGNIQLYR